MKAENEPTEAGRQYSSAHASSSREERTRMVKVIAVDQEDRHTTRQDIGKLAAYVRRTLEDRSHAVLLAKRFGPSTEIKDDEDESRKAECDEEHV